MHPDSLPHPHNRNNELESGSSSIQQPPSSPTLSPFRHHRPAADPHPHVAPTVDNNAEPPNTTTIPPPPPLSHSSSSGLRRRSHIEENDSIRITLRTPYTELGTGSRSRALGIRGSIAMGNTMGGGIGGAGRMDGFLVAKTKRVGELKDDLASGRVEDAGIWERDGMRLIHQGRIVRDEEVLGEIVGDRESPLHTFHLVARPLRRADQSPYSSHPTSPLLLPRPLAQPLASPTRMSPPSPSLLHPSLSSTNSRQTTQRIITALLDSIHYLLFTARFHLCHLLSAPVLKWEEAVPPPVIAQDLAKEAVMSVVRAFVREDAGREEGWENWESAFEDVEDLLQRLGDSLIEEVKSVWAGVTGRVFSNQGDSVVVEVDLISYNLNLPPLSDLSQDQLAHLLIYLRITTLIPLLSSVLQRSSPTPAEPSLTDTLRALNAQQINGDRFLIPVPNFHPPGLSRAIAAGQMVLRRTFFIPAQVEIPTISLALLSQLFFSFLRLAAIFWMLTRDMRWEDPRLWVITSFCGGWWLVEAIGKVVAERDELRRTREQERRQRQEREERGETIHLSPQEMWERQIADLARQAGLNAPAHAAAGARVRPTRPLNQPQIGLNGRGIPNTNSIRQTINNFDYTVPLFHLEVDNEQLRLPRTTTDRTRPGAQVPTPVLQPAALLPPSRWITHLVLPIYLWFVTLIPEFEALRGRAIRRRERAMRVLVGELAAARERAIQQAEGEEPVGEQQQQGTSAASEIRANASPTAPQIVLPDGLFPFAENYYRRVMERGEGIDWEEEREAQRALGIADDDEQQGGNGGMGLRML